MNPQEVEALWGKPDLSPQEVESAWAATDPALKDALRATVPPQEAWEHFPRQIREVHPRNADTSRLDRILASEVATKRTRVLGIWCPAGGRLAVVLKVGGEQVYVADVDRTVSGSVILDGQGLRVHESALASVTKGKSRHIEYLTRTIAALPAPMLSEYPLPARCNKCEGLRGRVQIPVLWIAAQLRAGHEGATWSSPEVAEQERCAR